MNSSAGFQNVDSNMNQSFWYRTDHDQKEKPKGLDETQLWTHTKFYKKNKSFGILDLQWSKKFWQNIIQYNNKVKQPQMTNDFFSYIFFFCIFFSFADWGKTINMVFTDNSHHTADNFQVQPR